MEPAKVFILLFVVATAVAVGARRFRIPYTVALVLAGLLLGSLHLIGPPHLTKDLLFAVFLPGLLFEAAFHIDFKSFWHNRGTITALAVPGVVAAIALTTVLITQVVSLFNVVQGFTWQYALIFSALIAATDPVAVVGLFRKLDAPRRLTLLLEGESLLNDGTAIVLFTLVISFVADNQISPGRVALDFVMIVGAGAVLGAAVGLLVSQAIRRIDDPMIEITLTTLAAYGAFIGAEELHVSGVIATVAAGLVCGNYAARVGMSPSTRTAVEVFWEYTAFALNSVVFLLIGFEVPLTSLAAAWPAILLAYLSVTFARAGVMHVLYLVRRRTRDPLSYSWTVVLTWGGLRGALSMVLALGLPPFPYRDLLVTMTVGVVLLSIVLQGLTMAPLLRALGVTKPHSEVLDYEVARGRLQAATAGLAEIDKLRHARFTSTDLLQTLRLEYEKAVTDAETTLERTHVNQGTFHAAEMRQLRRHLLLVEKEYIITTYQIGRLGLAAYERLLRDINHALVELDRIDGNDGD